MCDFYVMCGMLIVHINNIKHKYKTEKHSLNNGIFLLIIRKRWYAMYANTNITDSSFGSLIEAQKVRHMNICTA